MKEIKTKYAKKMIDGKFYSTIDIVPQADVNYLTDDEFKDGKPGYILVPYIFCEHTEESKKQYADFMRLYHTQHKYCPKCGGVGHTSTLVGYILNSDKKEEYKDMNHAVCVVCNDRHTIHDRLPFIKSNI